MYSTAEKYFLKYKCDKDMSIQLSNGGEPVRGEGHAAQLAHMLNTQNASSKEGYAVNSNNATPLSSYEQNGSFAPRLRIPEVPKIVSYNGKRLIKNAVQTVTSDPHFWGKSFWLSLHLSAYYYPENASAIVRDAMMNRILALPYEIPCANCRVHCMAHIDANKCNLSSICSTRDALFKFYVDFHNAVNKRKGVPEMPLEMAYAIYSGEAKLE